MPISTSLNRKIRPMDETDADWICEMLGNLQVTHFLQFIPIDPKQFLEKHASYLKLNQASAPLGAFVLECDGQRAGYAFLRTFEWEDEFRGVTEIGYLIDPQFWNKGIASELSVFLMKRAGKERVLAMIDDRHEVSKKVILKMGFSKIAASKKYPGNSIWERSLSST